MVIALDDTFTGALAAADDQRLPQVAPAWSQIPEIQASTAEQVEVVNVLVVVLVGWPGRPSQRVSASTAGCPSIPKP